MHRPIPGLRGRPATAVAALLLALALPGEALGAQASPEAPPWFGLPLPAARGNPHLPVVPLPENDPVEPVRRAPGELDLPELDGTRILQDVAAITGFSRASRALGFRLWGRIAGFTSLTETVEWVAERMRRAGLTEVRVETFEGSDPVWWPHAWEVRLLAAQGASDPDVILTSALPTAGSFLSADGHVGPAVDAGAVGDAGLPSPETVAGRIAVQTVRPAGGAYAERGATVARARALFERGAVAVLNVVEQVGNLHVRDFGSCGGPCFNLGTEDGAFLRSVLAEAAARGRPPPELALALEAEMLEGLVAENAVAVVEGESPEIVVVNAHADGWFDGAGDNADGLAVLLALARHFALPEHRPARTFVFVASAGHHGPGLNGPANFVRMNPEIAARTVLVVNLEHVAQRSLRPGDWVYEPTEPSMGFAISNGSPFLQALAAEARAQTGFRIRSPFGTSVPGDLGGYAPLGVPRLQAIHSGPLYHTSGDVLETISAPGLERAARFFAILLEGIDRAPLAELDP